MKLYRIKERIKQCRNIIWLCIPKCVQQRIANRYADKKAQREVDVFLHTKVSEDDVRTAFSQLHITSDVKIHSSLNEIGNIKGKHKPIVQCLQEMVLDKGHTLLAIAIPVKGSTVEYMEQTREFSTDAPIAMGVLSTYYAKQPGAVRSLEPTHSVVALGPKAAYYTAEHHLDETPFAAHSPYRKLLEQNGQILMIGAGIKHLTMCHLVEDLLGDQYPVKVYDKRLFPVDVTCSDGTIHHGKYRAHSRWSGVMRVPDYVQSRIMHLPSTQVVPLGASQLILLNVRDLILCELEELRKGNSIYGHVYISTACRQAIDEQIEWIKSL